MKKLLAILLALTLALTLVPTLAFAQNEDGAEPGIVEESKETPTEAPEGETTEEPKEEPQENPEGKTKEETKEEPKEEPKEEGKEEAKEESEGEIKDTVDVQAAPLLTADSGTADTAHANHPVCGASCSHTGEDAHTNATWIAWTETDSLPAEGGQYYLTADVTISDSWQPANGTALCLNGHSITSTDDNYFNVINIPNGHFFTLTDCAETPGKITHAATAAGRGVYMWNGSVFNMYGGEISGNVASEGGGVYVGSSGIFNMYGGAIKNNRAYSDVSWDAAGSGGGVLVADAAFNMYGGEISGNQSLYKYGGGVCAAKNFSTPSFNMYGGIITGNTAKLGGGDVYAVGANFNVTGGTIDGEIIGDLALGGQGTQADPYRIYTADNLKAFRDIVNGNNEQTQNTSAHARLEADIVLNDGTFDDDGNWSEDGTPDRWTPIGSGHPYQYRGTFDGDGHTISGLYVKVEGNAGLFGNVYKGTVKNVAVTGYVEGTGSVGGIVGYSDHTTITGCTNAATVRGGASNVGGIVGYLYINGNVRSCANLGSIWAEIDSSRQQGPSIGGIVGCPGDHIIIADCYNAGSITIQDSGTGEYYVPCLGGIVGSTAMAMDGSYISHCFSVGSLTYRGSASVEIRGIIGYAEYWFVNNCYWLEETAEDAVGGHPRSVNNTSAKTKAEFANELLPLLQNGDKNSPWTKTGYLSAAGMTLPLLKWQTGDAHTHSEKTGDCTKGISCECGYLMHAATSEHDWSAWQHQTTSHTRHCQNPGCGVTQSADCSGGTATCTEQATCEICGEKYGALEAHSYSTAWSTDDAKHWHECTVCGAKTDETKHADTDKDHKCDVCKKVLSQCADNDKDHKCDLCGKTLSQHSGGTATCKDQAKCSICGAAYGQLDPSNHANLKHVDAKRATTRSEGNIEYWYCDGCGKYFKDEAAAKEITQADTVIAKKRRTNSDSTDSTGSTADKTVKSSQTGDPGVMLYVGLAAMSLTGGAWLRRKKH